MRPGISAFVVVDDRGPSVAGQLVSGCVELRVRGEVQVASASVGLACDLGRPLGLPARPIPSHEWCHAQPLDLPDVVHADGRFPFSFRLPFAPILTVEPLHVQPVIAFLIKANDGSSWFDSAPLMVLAAPFGSLAEREDGNPYRTNMPRDVMLSRMRPSDLDALLRDRPECAPLLAPVAELLAPAPSFLRDLGLRPPSIAALGEEIVVGGRHRTHPDHDRVWWSLCCKRARADAVDAGKNDVVCRIEPRRVVPVAVGSRDVLFHIPVPLYGPPSFSSAGWILRWTLVAEVTTPRKSFSLESPLVVLPFVHPHTARHASPPLWLKGKVAHVLRRIQAAKMRPR